MKCQNCNRTITRKSKFCPHCGNEVILKKAMEQKFQKPKTTIGYSVILVAVGIILGFVITKFSENVNAPIEQNTASTITDAQVAFNPQVNQIARRFICPCGNCEDSIDVCSCEHKNGALEVKAFIAQQLQDGHKERHIIEMVQQKYSPQPSKSALLFEFEKQLN